MELIPDWPFARRFGYPRLGVISLPRRVPPLSTCRCHSCIERIRDERKGGSGAPRGVRRILHLARIYLEAALPRYPSSIPFTSFHSFSIHLSAPLQLPSPNRRSSLNKRPPAMLRDPGVSDARGSYPATLSRILHFLPSRSSLETKGRGFFFPPSTFSFFGSRRSTADE